MSSHRNWAKENIQSIAPDAMPRTDVRLAEHMKKLEEYRACAADQALYNDLLQFRFPPKLGQTDVNLTLELAPPSYTQEKRWSVTGEMYPPNQISSIPCLPYIVPSHRKEINEVLDEVDIIELE
ncbi:hypothetical protein B0H14DRAFT_3453101 [Mycena olivaceomarginata]|nr:hypothetical protein B0H14DRAFT_3453101 [Mycena olivaceomarginata]